MSTILLPKDGSVPNADSALHRALGMASLPRGWQPQNASVKRVLMTLALLLALLGSLIAMGVIVKRLENNG